jgi:stringent starvation protein B
VSDSGNTQIEQLQVVMTALLKRRLAESLGDVESALTKWRTGELGVFETHAELLKHAARAERMAERMARIGVDNAGALLRDAYDANLIERDDFIELVGQPPEDVSPSPVDADDPVSGLPRKRELVEELLGTGPILVHVDARHPLVEVPEQFRNDPKLVLRFGYGLTPSIVDLSVDDRALSGTLTFGGVPYRCILTWPAVYAVVSEVDQKGMVWPDDVPPSLVDHLSESSPEEAEATPLPAAKPRGSHLKLVK